MNDTNLNGRQKLILQIIKEKGEISRLNLSGQVSPDKKLSRITFIRDLNLLAGLNLVEKFGKGKNTRYRLKETNPLLTYLDLDNYFRLEMEERTAKINFNQQIFPYLKELYSLEEIALWEKSKKYFKEAREKLNPSIYKRELERFIIELSWKSSQIEGNTYSLIETETLVKENIKARGHPEEEAVMILNHRDAFKAILDNQKSFKKLRYEDIICLHRLLTKGLVAPGTREQKVRISGTRYLPPTNKKEIELAMKQLIQCLNQLKYPPERALVAAAMIAYLQPFADGNKRTSRILANAILLADNYFPLSYRNVDVNEYRSALIIFYETNNLFNFKRVFISQLQYAIEYYFRP
jgi:Fic family protein